MSESNSNPPSVPVEAKTTPIPPRYRWLLRFFLAGLALVGGTIVLRWRAGVHAEQRLLAKLASYRAAGEPVYIADMLPPEIPDDQNAAIPLENALKALDHGLPQVGFRPQLPSGPISAADIDASWRKVLETNERSLALLREARSRPGCVWNERDLDIFQEAAVSSSRYRDAGSLLCLAVLVAHADGDDRAAIDYLLDALSFAARTTEWRMHGLMKHLMAVVNCAQLCTSLETILPALHVQSDRTPTRDESPASRDQLRILIKHLLDDSAYDASWVRAMYSERAFLTEMLPQSGFVPPDALGYRLRRSVMPTFGRGDWVLCPIWQIDWCRVLDLSTAQCADARERIYGDPPKSRPPPPANRTFLDRAESMMSNIFATAFSGVFSKRTADLSIRRLAATAIAIRLYELDHGLRPAALEQLVPDYLPQVPMDPMVKGKQTILYVPDASPPFVATRAGGPSASSQSAASKASTTKVFRLATTQPAVSDPTTAPSTQRANEQHDVED